MKTKLTLLIILILLSIIFIFQTQKVRSLNKIIKEKETLLLSIQRNNETNITDLQNRNNELITRNDELKLLFNETENISNNYREKYDKKDITTQDCINQPINIDIVKLLQKAGV